MGKGFFVKQVPIFNSKLQIPVDIVFGVGGHFGLFKENFTRIRNGEPEYYDHNALNAKYWRPIRIGNTIPDVFL